MNSEATNGGDGEAGQAKSPYVDARLDYAWKWFAYHADQRIRMFNYMLVAFGIFATAIVSAVDKGMVMVSGILCFVGGVLALIFVRLDKRNERLVHLGEDVLGEVEAERLFVDKKKFTAHSAKEKEAPVTFGILLRSWDEDRPPAALTGLGLAFYNFQAGKHRFCLPLIAHLMATLFFGGMLAIAFSAIRSLCSGC
jgi:hypothetical protein